MQKKKDRGKITGRKKRRSSVVVGCKEANRRAFVKSYERVTRGKVEENCESQWMKKFWESLGCVLIVCLFLCRPYDLLQHPKELARQITLIDHGKYKTLISHDGLVVF